MSFRPFERGNSSNLTIVLFCALLVSFSAYVYQHLLAFEPGILPPMLFAFSGLVFRRVRALVPIVFFSYVLIYLVAVGRNWPAIGPSALTGFFVSPPGFVYGPAVDLFNFLYLPGVFLVVGLNGRTIPNQLSHTLLWRLKPVRIILLGFLILLLWKENIKDRYQGIRFILESRGVNSGGSLSNLWSTRLWLPVLLRTIIIESLERQLLVSALAVKISDWRPHDRRPRFSPIDLVCLVGIFLVTFSLLW